MRIDKPPMLTGNNKEDILRIRNYLYRVAEELEHSEVSGGEAEKVSKAPEKTGSVVKIYSSDTGATVGTSFMMREDIAEAKFFTAVYISDSSENNFVPVILFKRGNMARGTVQTGGNAYTVTLLFENGKIKLSEGSISGYSLREIYATVT